MLQVIYFIILNRLNLELIKMRYKIKKLKENIKSIKNNQGKISKQTVLSIK